MYFTKCIVCREGRRWQGRHQRHWRQTSQLTAVFAWNTEKVCKTLLRVFANSLVDKWEPQTRNKLKIYICEKIYRCESIQWHKHFFFCRFTNLNLNLCKDVSYYNVLQKETYFLQKKFACCFRSKTFFVKCFWKSLASCCVFLHPCAKFLQRGSITAWPNMILEVSLTQPDAAPSRSP